MKKEITRMLILVFVLLIAGCTEDDIISSRDWPRLHTLPVTNIVENGAQFNAEIIYISKAEILKYGFVWSLHSYATIDTDSTILVDKTPTIGEFNLSVTYNFVPNKTYYVIPFAVTDDYIVYGTVVSFRGID